MAQDRTATKELQKLLAEYKELKREIFGDSMFVIIEKEDEKVARYQQLFGLFYPQFRNDVWTDPREKSSLASNRRTALKIAELNQRAQSN